MGFLSMIGLVTAKEHASLNVLLNRVADERNQAFIDKQAAEEAANKYKQQVRDTCTRAEKAEEKLVSAEKLRDEAIDKYADLASKYDDVVEENLALRPDAEKFRAKAKVDAERKRNQRANAKVGETATAKLSGDRPAKKAVRK